MRPLRVIVCGGRTYADRATMFAVLDRLRRETAHDALTVILGAASGADSLAREWCLSRGVPFDWYPAEWERLGRAAGPIRNQRMLDEGNPNLVVAFPGGQGTRDMVRRAEAASVRVERIEGAERTGKPDSERDTEQ